MAKGTLVLKCSPIKPDKGSIRAASEIIKSGGIVAFPTETVYGLGGDALNADAVLEIFRAKRRPLDNPPIIHISDIRDVERLALEVPSQARKLMDRFWPGPLTVVFKRTDIIPSVTVANLGTVAIRMPKNKIAFSLIKESGCPIAAPSANLSGRPSPTCAKHVLDDLEGRIDAVIDGGPTRIGLESTVMDFSVSPPQLLRPGGLPFESIKRFIPDALIHPSVSSETTVSISQVRSPGMAHRHYAPKARMILVEGDPKDVRIKISDLSNDYKAKGMKVGVVGAEDTMKYCIAHVKISYGKRADSPGIARRIFGILREMDSEQVDIIIAEGVESSMLGLAIMNRLRRASEFNIVKA